MNNTRSFHELISEVLQKNIMLTVETFNLTKLNKHACTLIYQTIFNTIVETLQTAELKLQNETVNYVAQQYYDGTLINNQYELDPNIFTERAKLENISTKELVVITTLFKGTQFLVPIVKEIKRRN